MIRKLRGTTAVITGATSGIGRETALEFAQAGVSVVVAGRREERLQQLVCEIDSTGGHALGVVTDSGGTGAGRAPHRKRGQGFRQGRHTTRALRLPDASTK